MKIVQILIRSEFLKFEDFGEYTATSFDNVWRNTVYCKTWQGVCSPVCQAVYRASDKTVGQYTRWEDLADKSTSRI